LQPIKTIEPSLKYEGETDYRFIVATDLMWRHVEAFMQGWDMQGVTLSLLCDPLLLLHPLQSARLKNKQPGTR
jgi:hypothetical protein